MDLAEPSSGPVAKLIDEYFWRVARIHDKAARVLLIQAPRCRKALSIADRGYLIVRGQIAVGSRAQMLADDTIQHMYL